MLLGWIACHQNFFPSFKPKFLPQNNIFKLFQHRNIHLVSAVKLKSKWSHCHCYIEKCNILTKYKDRWILALIQKKIPALTADNMKKKSQSKTIKNFPVRNPTELLRKKNFNIMMHFRRHICRYWEKRCNTQDLNTHHLNWFFVKISLSHQFFLVSDIKAFLCQGLYNSIMT